MISRKRLKKYMKLTSPQHMKHKDAVKINSSIRLQDVKDYLNSLQSVQTHFKYKKYNSFVSPGANFEYEVDLMFISKSDENIGLVAVDNFTKMASIAIIRHKQPDEIISGFAHLRHVSRAYLSRSLVGT